MSCFCHGSLRPLYKDQFRNFKEKTGIFANPILWGKTALEKDADSWWDYWGSGKKVLHDFAVRVTSQPISIGAAERCWKAYAHIHCECPKRTRNRLPWAGAGSETGPSALQPSSAP